jgi:tetratricopeptide (TPR) repeat protein
VEEAVAARFDGGFFWPGGWKNGWLLIPLLVFGVAVCSAAMSHDAAEAARNALNRGQADEALHMLDAALEEDASDAMALNLRCRVLYSEERWDEAIASCERSVQFAPGNSNYHMWLGRAYGEKADRVSFVTAYKMAKLIRAEFEMAASLDPRNGPALSDLGEYYVAAPGVLGGGHNKAEAVAAQLDAFAPDRAHGLRARIAEHKKDYAGAEAEYRLRVSAAAHGSVDTFAQAWMDLGGFYRRRARWDEMQAAVESGAAAATDHGPALVDGASTLLRANREPKQAEQWMRRYLDGNSLSEEAPAFAVHARLASLYQSQGDTERAERELAAVHKLASDYAGLKPEKTNTDR